MKLEDAPSSPADLIADLNVIFSILDSQVEAHPGAIKIKTVCGYYLVAAGVPDVSDDHALVCVTAAVWRRSSGSCCRCLLSRPCPACSHVETWISLMASLGTLECAACVFRG